MEIFTTILKYSASFFPSYRPTTQVSASTGREAVSGDKRARSADDDDEGNSRASRVRLGDGHQPVSVTRQRPTVVLAERVTKSPKSRKAAAVTTPTANNTTSAVPPVTPPHTPELESPFRTPTDDRVLSTTPAGSPPKPKTSTANTYASQKAPNLAAPKKKATPRFAIPDDAKVHSVSIEEMFPDHVRAIKATRALCKEKVDLSHNIFAQSKAGAKAMPASTKKPRKQVKKTEKATSSIKTSEVATAKTVEAAEAKKIAVSREASVETTKSNNVSDTASPTLSGETTPGTTSSDTSPTPETANASASPQTSSPQPTASISPAEMLSIVETVRQESDRSNQEFMAAQTEANREATRDMLKANKEQMDEMFTEMKRSAEKEIAAVNTMLAKQYQDQQNSRPVLKPLPDYAYQQLYDEFTNAINTTVMSAALEELHQILIRAAGEGYDVRELQDRLFRYQSMRISELSKGHQQAQIEAPGEMVQPVAPSQMYTPIPSSISNNPPWSMPQPPQFQQPSAPAVVEEEAEDMEWDAFESVATPSPPQQAPPAQPNSFQKPVVDKPFVSQAPPAPSANQPQQQPFQSATQPPMVVDSGNGNKRDQRHVKMCRFFTTPRGCRNGSTCPFIHPGEDTMGSRKAGGVQGSTGPAQPSPVNAAAAAQAASSIPTTENCFQHHYAPDLDSAFNLPAPPTGTPMEDALGDSDTHFGKLMRASLLSNPTNEEVQIITTELNKRAAHLLDLVNSADGFDLELSSIDQLQYENFFSAIGNWCTKTGRTVNHRIPTDLFELKKKMRSISSKLKQKLLPALPSGSGSGNLPPGNFPPVHNPAPSAIPTTNRRYDPFEEDML
ncbi:hypothetical protein P280DRAFT_551311 [Massarina eburnea CBS 473.64]|uniref:C3H1-type domain-containing protein n=1 Tax=Massarina eburnea CBS 473.64 TaxID=1395130 RepID=A0A6A6RUB8_9PLEO|nr:hypothetical protein P280DRAFT_551311 [Massarina eburnea CBS 473.64]